MVTHKPKLYVYKRQTILNPTSNNMLPDPPQYGLSTTRDIAQQYSSVSIVSLRSHPRNQKIAVGLYKVIIVIWFQFYLKPSNY